MWHAAQLAQRLGYRDISVAEFGVAGGVTLMILARYAKEIEKATGVRIKVYGFDTGGGLPELEGAEDLPYWFRPSQYSMDVERLRRRLENAELIIGNVRGTVQDFFTKATRPPLAAVFNDLDLFSSSRDALRILEADSKNFLPRLFMYLDDVGGGPVEMYGPFNGELAANEMFNRDPPVFDAAGMIQSMSRKGNCWDNAPMEGCFGTLKTELVHQACYLSRLVRLHRRILQSSAAPFRPRVYRPRTSRTPSRLNSVHQIGGRSFILPRNLKDEIIEQNNFIRHWGGKFVVPIPEIHVYP
jgi:hypothetical protein